MIPAHPSVDRAFARPFRAAALALGLIAAGSGLAPAPAAAQDGEEVTIAALRFVSSSPLFIAYEKGYFEEEGLDVEFSFFQAAQPVAVAIAAGDADFGVTAFTGGFFNLAGKGALQVIGAQAKEEPGYDGSAILVSNQAHEAGFDAVEDFPGHSIAISQVGSSFHYMIGRVAEGAGFPLEEVELRPLQAVPNMISALRSGQVDSMIIVPHIAKALDAAGAATIVGWVADYAPYQVGGLFTSTENVEQRPEVVEAFVRAYQRGAQDYNDAMFQTDADGNPVYDAAAEEIIAIIDSYVYPDESNIANVKNGAVFIDPQARLDVGDIYRQVEWYQAEGLVDATVDPDSFLALGFVDGHFNLPAE